MPHFLFTLQHFNYLKLHLAVAIANRPFSKEDVDASSSKRQDVQSPTMEQGMLSENLFDPAHFHNMSWFCDQQLPQMDSILMYPSQRHNEEQLLLHYSLSNGEHLPTPQQLSPFEWITPDTLQKRVNSPEDCPICQILLPKANGRVRILFVVDLLLVTWHL